MRSSSEIIYRVALILLYNLIEKYLRDALLLLGENELSSRDLSILVSGLFYGSYPNKNLFDTV